MQVVLVRLEAASGASPSIFSGTLSSDVVTSVRGAGGGAAETVVFSDAGRVTLRLVPRDPGPPGAPASPSALNQVTITRYRVQYRRTDGRNVAGVDVPYPFESGTTFTVPPDQPATHQFEIVRRTAKEEAPLAGLRASRVVIATIADVTFIGRDLAGHEVIAAGSIGVQFGNFSDPGQGNP
ncbi:MAG: hypothetical protein FJW23_02320 [Acidimicrobiia bacterium]|nr:hypothetical protein [Acidimicrobiia bacterium]